ncbi:MAG: hypothetical protein QME74_02635 [Candidatus Edwardsbacteria bacterium]|nr:hypothetical protein [Candidatus Edwardsbacteria bacterium]
MKALHQQFIVDPKGVKTAVVLPYESYERLMEDLHDLAVVAERRNEAPVSFGAIKLRLKKDGVL